MGKGPGKVFERNFKNGLAAGGKMDIFTVRLEMAESEGGSEGVRVKAGRLGLVDAGERGKECSNFLRKGACGGTEMGYILFRV